MNRFVIVQDDYRDAIGSLFLNAKGKIYSSIPISEMEKDHLDYCIKFDSVEEANKFAVKKFHKGYTAYKVLPISSLSVCE